MRRGVELVEELPEYKAARGKVNTVEDIQLCWANNSHPEETFCFSVSQRCGAHGPQSSYFSEILLAQNQTLKIDIFLLGKIEKLFPCTVTHRYVSDLHPCGIFPKWGHKNGVRNKAITELQKCVTPPEMIHVRNMLCAFLRMHCGHAWCEGNESCENVVYVLHSENGKRLVTRLASA